MPGLWIAFLLVSHTSPFPDPAWEAATRLALEELGTNLLRKEPADAADFCPRFSRLSAAQRKAFYTRLVAAIAKHESSFNPRARYTEAFADREGKPVVSRGLLQLSYESARGYDCPVESPADLHDPETNLHCGVQVLAKWIVDDNAIGSGKRGGARYWAVLREPKRERIAGLTKALPFCRAAE